MVDFQELKKLKELLDEGVLTQEEFEVQKKIILSDEKPKPSAPPPARQQNVNTPRQANKYVPPPKQQTNTYAPPPKQQTGSDLFKEVPNAGMIIVCVVIFFIVVGAIVKAANGNNDAAPAARVTETTIQVTSTTTLPSQTTAQSQTTTRVQSTTAITTPATQPETTKSNFNPKDVSDATIKSIVTYNDYLTMYGLIIDDYLDNYQSLFKGTILYDQATFNDMKKQYASALEEQKEQYGAMGNSPIVGKDTLVDFLITYRDTLNEYVESMRPLINIYS
jgi:hypothetical protein